MSTNKILFMAVARKADNVVVATLAPNPKDTEGIMYKASALQIIKSAKFKSDVGPNTKLSLGCDPNIFHLEVDSDGRVFILLVSLAYPSRVAYRLLTEMQREFDKVGRDTYAACEEEKLSKSVKNPFTKLATSFSNPDEIDKVAKIQKDLDETTSLMKETIKLTLDNTEKTEMLESDTEALKASAAVFQGDATKLKRTMQWRNMKIYIAVALLVLAVIIYIVVPILDK